jgi:hypothetical protein
MRVDGEGTEMETEAIITGLIMLDVSATLAGNYLIRQELKDYGQRLTVIETQHNHNHKMEV